MNRHQLLLTALMLFSFASFSQKKDLTILLKSGELHLPENVSKPFLDSFNARLPRYLQKGYALLQFSEIPSAAVKARLAQQGIELLEYVPNYSYTASIKGDLKPAVLEAARVRAVLALSPQQKMHAALPKGTVPHWAVKVPGSADVWIQFAKSFTAQQVLAALKEKNIEVLSASLQQYGILSVRIAVNRLMELAGYPFIAYVQPAPPADEPLNTNSRNGSRSNFLNASVADGGRGLNGEGITIGVGDNSDVQQHIDFSGRLINRAATTHVLHGTHVTGTAAGAGIISEQARGYAPKATIVSQVFSGILLHAEAYVNDYGMVVTNNSYGNVVGCEYNGLYDLYASVMDQQAFALPNLQHVFATGNSGGDECAPYPKGFGTVLGGYQSAKNVLCVGNTTSSGDLANPSSKGPVRDGRLKPEITAMGTVIRSTAPTNSYANGNGTSMSAPAVSGGLALLYQRYRQLHNGANPKSGLMKALICNGAADKGNAGPDFSNGFGWMNLERSLLMLEKAQYKTGSVSQGSIQKINIPVPPNAAALKVMLYWHDPAASLISSQALVHNLDLEVAAPSAAIQFPQVLSTSLNALTQASVNGVDHLNNIEQVTINQPVAGEYTIQVKGTTVGQHPEQEYFVVYDIIEAGTRLTYPTGGAALVPGEKVIVQWDAFENVSNPFHLQYSTDGGASWLDIKTDISNTARQQEWTVPSTASGNVKLRLQHGSSESVTAPFTVLGLPVFSFATVQCEGYINLTWNAVAGATGYEVLMLRGAEMQPIAQTTGTSYIINNLSKDSTYWVTVRAKLGDKAGRRADAKSRQPSTGNCSGNISDNDLKLNDLVAPASGRAFTSTALGAAVPVTIEVKNLDNIAATGFAVQYAINGSDWHTENVTATIAAGAVYQHTFNAKANLSQTGTYQLIAVVKNNLPDAATGNDTVKREIKHLANEAVNVSNPFQDDLEAAAPQTVTVKTMGAGLDRFDFESSTSFGRLRTFVNTGMAHSGSKAFTLDADRSVTAGSTNFLTGTYNLANYAATSHDLRLEFQYNHHSQVAHVNNKVWIRGDDTQPWIEAYSLGNSTGTRGHYITAGNIELSNLLAAAGQNFSASFQIRWGQFGQTQASDRWSAAGYTIDDIRLFEAVNDLQMLSIVTPAGANCALGSTSPVTIKLYNSARTTLTQVPVKYRLNNGNWVEEVIASIQAKDTLEYTFTQPVNLSAFDTYNLETVVALATDNYAGNDTASLQLVNSPVVNSYPYLQKFEGDKGHWYTGGSKSSWQWGTPASEKIKGAASGAGAWKTNLTGNHNDLETSYLYSPCFNISGLQNPALSFSVAMDLEDCGITLCDGAWVEYSEDGLQWKKIPATSSTNWYNKTDTTWSIENDTQWHVATTALPKVANLRLRFVFSSDPAVNREGIAIDDIHIYDLQKGIYNGTTLTAPVRQVASGNGFVHFEKEGGLLASVHPHNQNLGNTAVRAFIFTDSVRSQKGQYYHGRNITIKPTERDLKDSVTVRFYFLESETDLLLAANNCAGCDKPLSAYGLGITQYTDADTSFENGTLRDNYGGTWQFIAPQKIAIVPYDKGYYAEFKVAHFSEFWLNSGGLSGTTALPLKLLHFSAQKAANDNVLLQWTTAAEDKVAAFEIEVARSAEEVQRGFYQKIGAENSKGNAAGEQQYTFTDGEAFKTGTRFYRLKIKNEDGSFSYSPIRSVSFGSVAVWQVYPNPSSGKFNLVYQAAAGTTIAVQLNDITSRIVAHYTLTANGYVQKQEINLTTATPGVYLLQVVHGSGKEVYKLYRQ